LSDFKVIIAAMCAIVFGLVTVWLVAEQRGYRSRGRRRGKPDSGNRSADKRQLSPREKKLFTQAQISLKQGKPIPAARILEQINMPREAIQALEDHGLIHEAATILMRMQRQNRAGVIYARHGMWKDAAKCFQLAKMPLEAAKCNREAGNWQEAADLFSEVQRYKDAAECHERIGNLHLAAKLNLLAGEQEDAMRLYKRVVQETENLSRLELENNEVDLIVEYLTAGNADLELADLIVNKNKLNVVLHSLVTKGFVKQAADIYLRATTDIGPQLISEVSYEERSAENLAEVFLRVSHFSYAGMVYERMEQFDRAGDAFEKAEDYDRAAYCFERAGNTVKVKILKEKAANISDKPTARKNENHPVAKANPFALSEIEETEGYAFQSKSPEDEEATQVLTEVSANSAGEESNSHGRFSISDPASTTEVEEVEDKAEKVIEVKETENQEESTRETLPDTLVRPSDSSSIPLVSEAPTKQSASKNPQDAEKPDNTSQPTETKPQKMPEEEKEEEPSKIFNMDKARAIFHSARFFSELDFEQKNKLWSIGETRVFAEGDTILDFNDEPSGVYVIVQGQIDVFRQVRSREKYVDRMREGESFGELWLLADQPTTVKFSAAKPVKVHVIERGPFDELMDKDGTLARKLYKRFTMRLLRRLLSPQNNKNKSQAS
jgi:tetratricopeptide (TPR) repeat protein